MRVRRCAGWRRFAAGRVLLERSARLAVGLGPGPETAIRSPHGGPKITWGGTPFKHKTGRNRLHFDLAPPLDGDQHAEVDRLVALGATRLDTGRRGVGWVELTDPDGNEFCVLTPR